MKEAPTYEWLKQENERLQQEVNRLLHNQPAFSDNIGVNVPDPSMIMAFIQSLPLNFYAKDTNGRFIFGNDRYCRRIGRSLEQFVGLNDFDIHPTELAEKYIRDDQRIMASGSSESIEEQWQSIGGETSYVKVIKAPIYKFGRAGEAKEVLGTMGVFWDITSRKKAELALQKSEERYRGILENIKEGYVELDGDLSITFINISFCTILGRRPDELLTGTLADLAAAHHRAELGGFLNRVRHGYKETDTGDFVFPTPDGRALTLNLSISPVKEESTVITGVRGIVRDITDDLESESQRKNLERQLVQAQKMESIGTLAGGIAHDFNNILFIIQGYTDLALADVKRQRNPQVKLLKVRDACTRAASLIEQILSFARHSEKSRLPLDLRALLQESAKLLRSALPTTISISLDLSGADRHLIVADPTEIHQIIMNLCTNASQAMPNSSGALNITLKEYLCTGPEPGLPANLKPGRYLLLSISDTGRGIPKAIISRIFEPFFTTKKIGEGAGLGLSVVHGIVTSMAGGIAVESEEGAGSTFRVCLPVSEKEPLVSPEAARSIKKGSREHILLVEDEGALLNMIHSMLAELNYTSTPCRSGLEAFELFSKNPFRFDALLTDQTMPGLTGEALCVAVRAIRPTMPLVLCTGFSEQITDERIHELGINVFLNKPILIENLAETLFNLLNG